MTVVNIEYELAARNPNRAKQQIERRMAAIDEGIVLLALAKDSAALTAEDEALIRGLDLIHRRLRRECDRLFTLLSQEVC